MRLSRNSYYKLKIISGEIEMKVMGFILAAALLYSGYTFTVITFLLVWAFLKGMFYT
jgi:hypothetical protein